jgi:hypothetical protein
VETTILCEKDKFHYSTPESCPNSGKVSKRAQVAHCKIGANFSGEKFEDAQAGANFSDEKFEDEQATILGQYFLQKIWQIKLGDVWR